MTTLPLQWFIDVHGAHSPAEFSYEANGQELEAIKCYAGVEDITKFTSQLTAVPLPAGKFRVTGMLHADAVQASVVDLGPVPVSIEENFTVDYWPQELIEDAGEKAFSLEQDPPEPIVGGRILIGEFLCELFSVSLDPYPRNADDAFEWTPPAKEPQATPFAELGRLRQKKTDPR